MAGYKERLIKELYGGVYPFFWSDSFFVERLFNALNQLNIKTIAIRNPTMIRELLTEEEAKRILKVLGIC